jgi:hypothetical protein
MSATTLPLVAAMLLTVEIEIVAVDCNGQGIYLYADTTSPVSSLQTPSGY